ncbi:urease accessory protein UreD [Algicella marina]|uniref:Urease accessory protein UreD n=1 Tax=Algicella marina TaxID=2683284 RepID=A0A6P1T525_9RHOB|nr:urease accessory protein UreD [Algicella marina]QHQ36820.1 urease accessory protein [Algicella marina]
MFDAGLQSDLQRARGRGFVGWRAANGRTKLADLHQSGCAKILLPQTYGAPPEAVIINTSGGITGGDRLTYGAEVGAGASATVTTQAAERIYRASHGTARIDTHLRIGAGASLHWLPQETILFEGAALARTLTVEMAEDATALLLETVVLGREAMGETLAQASLTETWRITRDGRLAHAEALRLGPEMAALQGAATLNGHRALATLVYLAPDAENRLEEARALLPEGAAASAWGGRLVCRFLGAPAMLKPAIAQFLTRFRAAPLPRVWHL